MNINDPNNLLDDDSAYREPSKMQDLIPVQYFYDTIKLNLAHNSLTNANIESTIFDEMTANVLQIEARAIGGARLMVQKKDYAAASKVLLDLGIMTETNSKADFWIVEQLKHKSQFIPLIGSLDANLRVVLVVGLVIASVFLGVVVVLLQ